VRVAACTHHTFLGDAAANAESVLRLARACHDDNVARALYAGTEVVRLLDRGHRHARRTAGCGRGCSARRRRGAGGADAGVRRRGAVALPAPDLQHRGGRSSRLGARPGPEVVPAHLLEFYERRQLAPGDDVRGAIRMGDVDVPFGPGLLFTATDMPGFVLHVEICVDMFVPLPPSAQAALAGATVLTRQPRSRSDVPRTAARRAASSRCLAGYVYAAADEGESTTDLAWDGRTMIWENGVCLAQSERFTQG